jgi:hypothetical protein
MVAEPAASNLNKIMQSKLMKQEHSNAKSYLADTAKENLIFESTKGLFTELKHYSCY